MCADCDIKARSEARAFMRLDDETPTMTPDERRLVEFAHAERELKPCVMCLNLSRSRYCSQACADKARDYSE